MADEIAKAITLEEAERELSATGLRLTFSPAVERAFVEETRDGRLRLIIWTAAAATILYDLFLINDWMALHDRFREMVVARLFIFTPMMLCTMLFAYKGKAREKVEWVAAAGAIVAVLLPMVALMFSNSPNKLSYQYGSLLVMMFATLVQRVRFRPASIAVAAILVIQAGTTYLSYSFKAETYIAIVSFFCTAATLQLIALFILEQAERRSFLLALRGRMLHDQLLLSARTDALTGLYNRRHLADTCQELWARPFPQRISAILLDVDHFKLFNDSYGHLQGDDCLQTVSACIRRALPYDMDLAFRFGGEEMLILLPATHLRDARDIAEIIRREIAAEAISHTALGDNAVVTASFGVADVTAPESTAAALFAAADAALYSAKRAGRNKVWPPREAPSNVATQLEVA